MAESVSARASLTPSLSINSKLLRQINVRLVFYWNRYKAAREIYV